MAGLESTSRISYSKISNSEELLLTKKMKVISYFKENFSGEKISITIASWNVKNASYKNEAKMDTIARVINEISPDVIALQEIASPGKQAIDEIIGRLQGHWHFKFILDSRKSSKTCLAFLWNIETIQEGHTWGNLLTLKGYFRRILCKTFVAQGKFNFKLVNFHLCPAGDEEHATEINSLHEVHREVEEEEYSVIFIGDFKEYPCNDHLKELMYENIIRPDQHTNVSGSHCLDNMIVPYSLYLCCDEHKVKKDFEREGFDHYPIFAKFSTPPNRE